MKELTIKFKGKKYITTDEKQIEVYEKYPLADNCSCAGEQDCNTCPFIASNLQACFDFYDRDDDLITHSLKTISDYTLNLYMMQIGKKYLCDKSLGIIEMLTDGTLAKSEDKSIFAVSQQDRFKEYVPKMVSKTVERFVSDACITNIEECGFSTIDICKSENDVRKNKITITFEVEE